jgi:hypothetical protein
VSGIPPHSPGIAVFARQGTVLLVRPLPWRPRDEVSRYAPLRHVTPLLQQLAADAPHVRVGASREGARLLVGPAGAAVKTFRSRARPGRWFRLSSASGPASS